MEAQYSFLPHTMTILPAADYAMQHQRWRPLRSCSHRALAERPQLGDQGAGGSALRVPSQTLLEAWTDTCAARARHLPPSSLLLRFGPWMHGDLLHRGLDRSLASTSDSTWARRRLILPSPQWPKMRPAGREPIGETCCCSPGARWCAV